VSDDEVVEAVEGLASQFETITELLSHRPVHAVAPQAPVQGLIVPTWAAAVILGTLLTIGVGSAKVVLDMRDEMSTGFATINVQITDIFERRMDNQSERIGELSDEIDDLEDRYEDHLQTYHNGNGR